MEWTTQLASPNCLPKQLLARSVKVKLPEMLLLSHVVVILTLYGRVCTTLSVMGQSLAQFRGENDLESGNQADSFFSDSDFMDFSLDTDEDSIGEDDLESLLPPCTNETAWDDIPCSNSTAEPMEIRYEDLLFQRLISQIWSDFQVKVNSEAQIGGVTIDPLDIDALLPKPIDLHQKGGVYSVSLYSKS